MKSEKYILEVNTQDLTYLRQQDHILSKSYLPHDSLRSTEIRDDANILSSANWNTRRGNEEMSWTSSTEYQITLGSNKSAEMTVNINGKQIVLTHSP